MLRELKSFRESDTDRARVLADRARQFALEHGLSEGLVKVNNELSVIHSYQGNSENSIAYAIQALKGATDLMDTLSMVDALHNIGIELYYQENWIDAMNRFDESYVLSLHIMDTSRIANSLINLGLIYGEQGEVSDEIKSYENALALFYRSENFEGVATASLNLGEVYRILGQSQKAERYLRDALTLFEEQKHMIGITEIYSSLAELLFDVGDETQGLTYVMKGMALAKQHDYIYDEIIFLDLLEGHYARKQQFKMAYQYLTKAKVMRDSLRSTEKAAQIVELEKRYSSLEKEKEIELLLVKNEVSEARMIQIQSEKRLFLTLFGFVLAASVALLILFRKLSRSKAIIEGQNVQMQKFLEAREKLFGVIAHDLKGPISAFATMTALLVTNEDLDKSQFKKYLQKLEKNAKNLKIMLDNLLVWSLAQSGDIQVARESLLVNGKVSQTIGLLAEMAELKGVRMLNRCNKSALVSVTPIHLMVMLRNLIANAIKFTEAGGEVVISVEERSAEIRIVVEDSGVGMSQKEVQLALDGGSNKMDIRNSENKGTGLGILICMRLSQLNRGRLEIESEKGQGSRFSLIFPAM
jgi:two-component system sensor histidine kinase/response regulator